MSGYNYGMGSGMMGGFSCGRSSELKTQTETGTANKDEAEVMWKNYLIITEQIDDE